MTCPRSGLPRGGITERGGVSGSGFREGVPGRCRPAGARGGNSGAKAGDSDNNGQTPATPPGTTTPEAPADAKAELKAALDEANKAITDGQAALAKGDFAAYGTQQTKLSEALKKALDAEARLGATPAPAATPSATPSPSPSS